MIPIQPGPTSPWMPETNAGILRGNPRLCYRAAVALTALSALYRRLMVRTRFIAITGSYGKSTASRCLAAILSAHQPTNFSDTPRNGRADLALNLLRTRLHHRFTVIEVGTKLPGALLRASWQIDPDIAAVLAVGLQHTNEFPTLEDTAREKVQLLRGIRGRRTAVLNGDDPRVRAMAAQSRGKVFLFGTSPEFDLWADHISGVWPDGLCFTAHAGPISVRIETQLIGTHWLAAVLGAIGCALAAGVSLPDCAAPLRGVKPFLGRLSPHQLPSGAHVLRDEINASLSSLFPALDVLRQARASRRIIIMGDVFDTPLKHRDRLMELGRLAAGAADVVLLVGQRTNPAVRAAIAAGLPESAARSFHKLEDAADWLRRELRPGDLLLIRARGQFHMERLYFAQLGTIQCWMSRCELHGNCDRCEYLGFEPDPPA